MNVAHISMLLHIFVKRIIQYVRRCFIKSASIEVIEVFMWVHKIMLSYSLSTAAFTFILSIILLLKYQKLYTHFLFSHLVLLRVYKKHKSMYFGIVINDGTYKNIQKSSSSSNICYGEQQVAVTSKKKKRYVFMLFSYCSDDDDEEKRKEKNWNKIKRRWKVRAKIYSV